MHATASTFAQLARQDAERMIDQGEFDFLMPYGDRRGQLKPQEVALCMGRSERFVYDEIEREGCVLEVLKLTGRERAEIRITRRSVLLWLALSALEGETNPRFFGERIGKLIDGLGAKMLDAVIACAAKRRARL